MLRWTARVNVAWWLGQQHDVVIGFGSMVYGRLMEFTDVMISALEETVYITMDDNRRIGACNRMGAGSILG